MISKHLTVQVIGGLAICGLMAGCSDSKSPTGPSGGPSTPSSPQVVDRTFVLAPGESASVDNGALELVFKSVLKDERCPGDALCLAGVVTEAKVEFQRTTRKTETLSSGVVTTIGLEGPLQMSTTTNKSVRIGIYTVDLENLSPYPFASQPAIQPEQWRVTVRITSALP
jgi:hypothetical protein